MRTEIVWPAGCETWNAGERLDLLLAIWNLGVKSDIQMVPQWSVMLPWFVLGM